MRGTAFLSGAALLLSVFGISSCSSSEDAPHGSNDSGAAGEDNGGSGGKGGSGGSNPARPAGASGTSGSGQGDAGEGATDGTGGSSGRSNSGGRNGGSGSAGRGGSDTAGEGGADAGDAGERNAGSAGEDGSGGDAGNGAAAGSGGSGADGGTGGAGGVDATGGSAGVGGVAGGVSGNAGSGAGNGGSSGANAGDGGTGGSSTQLFFADFEYGGVDTEIWKWVGNSMDPWFAENVDGNYRAGSPVETGTYWQIIRDVDWADQVIEADVYPVVGSGSAGVVGRYNGFDNNYRLFVNKSTSTTVSMSKTSDGASASLGSAAFSVVLGGHYRLKLSMIGDRIRGYVDDVLYFDVTDSSVLSGSAGVGVTNLRTQFDNVRVTSE